MNATALTATTVRVCFDCDADLPLDGTGDDETCYLAPAGDDATRTVPVAHCATTVYRYTATVTDAAADTIRTLSDLQHGANAGTAGIPGSAYQAPGRLYGDVATALTNALGMLFGYHVADEIAGHLIDVQTGQMSRRDVRDVLDHVAAKMTAAREPVHA